MKLKSIILFVFLLVISSSVVIATPPSMPLEWQCCSSHQQGEPIMFNLMYTDQNNETFISRGFGAGGAGIPGEFQNATQINITKDSSCCDYVSDSAGCYQCIDDAYKERERNARVADFLTKILPAILFFIFIGIALIFIKSIKSILKFSWSKFILSIILLVVSLFSGIAVLSPMYGYGNASALILIIAFWPFFFVLSIERFMLGYVDWIHAVDIPFLIIAVILTALWFYTISSLIVLLIRKIKK